MNAAWHGKHVLPRNATLEQRVAWHREHQLVCACRPVPASLKGLVDTALTGPAAAKRAAARPMPAARAAEGAPATGKGRASVARKRPPSRQARPKPAARVPSESTPLDPRFAKLVARFAAEAGVTTGGKGFGATALKHDGKIFAMLVRGRLVAKLPKARVDELVARGEGEHFDPGHGRRMKEWLSATTDEAGWLALAREALRFARAS